MNRSLRLRLTIAVIAATAPVIATLALLLYHAVADAVRESFDRQLIDDARVMSNLIELESEGYELELEILADRFAANADVSTTHQLWTADGTPLVPGNGLDDARVGPKIGMEAPRLWDGELGDGTRVRLVGFQFVPRTDEDQAAPAHVDPVAIALARDTLRVDALLADLAAWFWMLGTGMVLVSSGVAAIAVSRGLSPMATVTERLAEIDENKLDVRLPTTEIVVELLPFVDRLNRLLERLDAAFTRERRFSADVSHELRTPLAVLRASIDLALDDARADQRLRTRLEDMRETVDQTGRLVDDLLELARAEQGPVADTRMREPVDVGDLVVREWQLVERTARERGLGFRNVIPPATYVESEPASLRRIVANLLSNAVSHTERDGWVEVSSDPARGCLLSVRDSGPPIEPEHLPRLFDRFWRADSARTAVGEHAGIGLSLARALARRVGHDLVVRVEGREVVFELIASARETRASASP